MRETADVLVAGAGPAGLLLAADLAAAGLRVTVLADGSDQAAADTATEPAIVYARSLEHLDALGAADAIVAAGQAFGQVSVYPGVTIDLTRLPTRFPFALVAPWHQIRQVLASRAAALGARFVGAGRIAAVSQDADAACLTVGAPGRTFAAPYLVGADAAGCAVRAALGQEPGFGHGRVLLAGHAARSCDAWQPGQDVNDGLHDAANLGWKLAATLRHGAGPALLGSYGTERDQAARQQARSTRRLMRLSAVGSGLLGRIVTAGVALGIRRGPAAGLAAGAVSGLSCRYRRGDGSHPLAGRRAPDLALHGRPTRLYEALRERRPVLLISAASQTGTEVPPLLELWAGRIAVAAPVAEPALLTLVCPDGYIGWATDSASPPRRYAGLRQALGEYCGPPAIRAAASAARPAASP